MKSSKSLTASDQSFFQQPVTDFSSSKDSSICTIHSAVLYNFQQKLMLKKGLQITCIQDTAQGVASIIALKCLTIPWLSSCTSELVVLDNKHRYLEGWIQDPANSLKHYQGQGGPWILASWILHTVFKPAFTGKVFSLTTAPLTATIHVSHLSALLSAALGLMLLL